MREIKRRRVLRTVGATAAVLVAGCSGGGDGGDGGGGDGGDGGGGDGGSAISVNTPQGDATINLKVSVGVPDEDLTSLVVDFEKVVFEREEGDAVGFAVGETGLDLTEVANRDEGYTVAEGHSFPTSGFTTAKLYMPVQEATLEDGSSVEFESADPLEVDLVIVDEPLDISSGNTGNMTISVTPTSGFSGEEWSFNTGFSMIGG